MSIAEIDPKDLKARLDSGEKIALVDVRESDEREICNIGGVLVPLSVLADRIGEIPDAGPVVVYCRSGGRSKKVVERLSQQGFTNLINLRGGMLKWIEDVDPSLTPY